MNSSTPVCIVVELSVATLRCDSLGGSHSNAAAATSASSPVTRNDLPGYLRSGDRPDAGPVPGRYRGAPVMFQQTYLDRCGLGWLFPVFQFESGTPWYPCRYSSKMSSIWALI